MMESDLPETVSTDGSDEDLLEYVRQNQKSTNTQLFSILTLLNAYVPDSYLPMEVCRRILGPPDPIHGGPPFEERMKPFTDFISTATPGYVCMCDQEVAQIFVEILNMLGINRSTTAKQLLRFLCEGEAQPDMVDKVKELLIKREMTEEGKEKFSRLISDILAQEEFSSAVSVLKTASEKFRHVSIYPQTIARLFYIIEMDYETAAKWAERAIERDPRNSYVADTLGQVPKNRLRNACKERNDLTSQGSTGRVRVQEYADEALKAFKEVEEKAMKEVGSEEADPDGLVRTSASFNNRGHFGFIQVAKIVFKTLGKTPFTKRLSEEVEDKFEFFEWYLTYSKPDVKTLEPPYFWRDIASCYEHYTGKTAGNSTSIPGLLDFLNHGLFPRRTRQDEVHRTTAELEGIAESLKTAYQEDCDHVVKAMQYILSNIILSNRNHDSPQLARLTRLQTIIRRFFNKQPTQPPQPEFYLLALMLLWPEGQRQDAQQEAVDEVKGQAAEDDESNDKDTDEDEETEEEAPLPPDLQQHVRSMKNAFEGTYAKYLRGRYLLPLFFLGTGHGLSKWIHKSRLDAIVVEEFESQLAEQDERQKTEMINDMWYDGKVWQIQRIRDLLRPVQVESHQFSPIPEWVGQEVSVRVGGQELQAKREVGSPQTSELFYLYFNIEGPVVINVSTPHDEQ